MTKKTNNAFEIGEYAELISAITDGYMESGDYNVVFPPPTIVQIAELTEGVWLKYGVKVIKEKDLPEALQGKNFRTALINHAKKGNIVFIGHKQAFFDGDEEIDQKYWEKTYWNPEVYLRKIL